METSDQWWEVRAHEQACASSTFIDLSYLTTDYENPDPIDHMDLRFVIPNEKYSSYETGLLKAEDQRMFMSIQPGGIRLKETDFITNLRVLTEPKTYNIQLDDSYQPQADPRFLLVGTSATEIWDEITALKKVTVEFDLSTGKHYSIEVKGMFMDRVARMFSACGS